MFIFLCLQSDPPIPLARIVQCTLVYAQRSNGCSIAPCIRVARIRPAKNSRTRDVITTRETSRVDVFVRFIDGGGLFVSAQLLPVRYTVLPAPTAARPRATIIETEVVERRIIYLYKYYVYVMYECVLLLLFDTLRIQKQNFKKSVHSILMFCQVDENHVLALVIVALLLYIF